MNILKTISAVALAVAVTAYAEDKPTAATDTFINRLVAEAVSKHPKIEAAQARTRAAFAAIGVVRLWEDPEIGLGATAASRSYREGNGDIAVGFSQMLPRRGLYDAQKRKATSEQKAQSEEQRMTANELGLAVAQSVIELALADDALALQGEELQWLDTIVKTARERAKNPAGNAVEPLRMESELALRTQKREAAERQRSKYAQALNLLLGRDPRASWPALTLPDNGVPATSAPSLRAKLEGGNPRLVSLRHQIDAARAEADAARAKRKPVFSVGVDTSTYSGGGFFDAMPYVKMTIPLFNRSTYQADIARAEQLRFAAQYDLAAQERELATQLNSLLTEAENGQRLATAYKSEVLPMIEKTVEAIQNAWISSKATLLEVLDSRRVLIDARQEQKRAIATEHASLAAITALTGGFSPPKGKQP